MTKKILIVDDETLFREMLAEVLTSAGYEIVQACDGEEGLTAFKTSHPKIVITDIRMPKRNGFQMSMDILRLSPHTPIIFVSGWYDPSELSERASFLKNDAFFLYFLKKPFHLEQLLKMLREVETLHKNHQAA